MLAWILAKRRRTSKKETPVTHRCSEPLPTGLNAAMLAWIIGKKKQEKAKANEFESSKATGANTEPRVSEPVSEVFGPKIFQSCEFFCPFMRLKMASAPISELRGTSSEWFLDTTGISSHPCDS